MRLFVLLLLPVLMLCAGQNKPSRKEAKPAAATKKVAAKPEIPAGAVQTGPNSWRYKDEKGEIWIYRRTPFGMTRIAEAPTAEPELPPGLKAVQVGDEIRFERSGPFGPTRWSRKLDELTDIERKVWERDRPKSDAPPDAKDTAKE
jgi:hypothetical protein